MGILSPFYQPGSLWQMLQRGLSEGDGLHPIQTSATPSPSFRFAQAVIFIINCFHRRSTLYSRIMISDNRSYSCTSSSNWFILSVQSHSALNIDYSSMLRFSTKSVLPIRLLITGYSDPVTGLRIDPAWRW